MARLQGAMPSWMTDGSAALPTNGATFDPQLDPNMNILDPSSMNFIPNSSPFDLQGFPPQQQVPQHMGNGTIRNASPAFQPSGYQMPPSSIPSKRPRQREDSLGASPHQTPGALPASRSETPQQVPYGGFPGGQQPQQQFSQPNPYQHLQHGGSANASPSPIMQNQQFRGPSGSQRVQTASPSPFSSAAQGYSAHMSPPQQDAAGRMNTPQGNAQAYIQGLQYGQGFNPNFPQQSGQNSMAPQGMTPQQIMYGQNPLPQDVATRNYQIQLAQQRQQIIKARSMQQPNQVNQMVTQQNHAMGMAPKNSPPRAQQGPQRNMNSETFVKALITFMHGRGHRVNTQPVVGDRPISLMQLYYTVIKKGGSKKLTQANGWPSLAGDLQFSPTQYPTAPQELKEIFERNLAAYEDAWIQSQQQKRLASGGPMNPGPPLQGGESGPMAQQMSPTKPQQMSMHAFNQQTQTPAQHPQAQQKPQSAAPGSGRPQMVNGVGHSQTPGAHNRQSNSYNTSRSITAQPLNSGPSQTHAAGLSGPNDRHHAIGGTGIPIMQYDGDISNLTTDPSLMTNFEPRVETLESHGGLDLNLMTARAQEIAQFKPTQPRWAELGLVNIQALSMSLQSNLHAEVRNALDTLVVLSEEQRIPQGIQLNKCDDLLESLVECAEVQLDVLSDRATEESDDLMIMSYEDIFRSWKLEKDALQEVPLFGTTEYELDKAAERLICITTILRNFSFHQNNHPRLADPSVIKFFASLIRLMGTRNMLMRTYLNTADVMKDLITFFSNVSYQIELSSEDEGMAILKFLLAFAACPPPSLEDGKPIIFAQYDPRVHRYLPAAVDSLAKILARDEPNRTIFKSIFQAESLTSTPYDLLTRTFALAIAPIPEFSAPNVPQIVEMRKPLLMQGMLAAEILSNLAPGYESGLARAWLSSEDGFAMSLSRLVSHVSKPRQPPPQAAQRHGRAEDPDLHVYNTITQRGLAIGRRLAEKAQNPDDPSATLPADVLPKRETVLGSLLTQNMDTGILKQFCAFITLET